MNFQKVSLAPGLYFVGVPIGTARDITLRALDVLASADLLAAEDTRSLKRLLDIHGVPRNKRPTLALHDHSNTRAQAQIIDAIANGQSVAYASEAGMPLIADPGYELGLAARNAGHKVTCAPGPSAVPTALALSGLPTDAFFFAGFLPNNATARRSALENLRDIPATLVFYESAKRVAGMLLDASAALGGDRLASVCREMTKKFEETRRGTVQELADHYASASTKGEIVVLIDRNRSENVSESSLEEILKDAMTTHSLRDAVDLVSGSQGVPRRQVYQMALQLTKG